MFSFFFCKRFSFLVFANRIFSSFLPSKRKNPKKGIITMNKVIILSMLLAVVAAQDKAPTSAPTAQDEESSVPSDLPTYGCTYIVTGPPLLPSPVPVISSAVSSTVFAGHVFIRAAVIAVGSMLL